MGGTINIFHVFSKNKHSVGDTIELIERDTKERKEATVIGLCEEDPKYHKTMPSGQLVNGGKDYYKVEVKR